MICRMLDGLLDQLWCFTGLHVYGLQKITGSSAVNAGSLVSATEAG